MIKRITIYAAIGPLLLFGGCSSSTGSGGGGGNSGGGNEPSNSPMSIQTNGLDSELVIGQQREYGLSVSDDDGFSSFDVEATLGDYTLWAKQEVPSGTSWDTTVTFTPDQQGTLTLSYSITDDFSAGTETETGDHTQQIVGPITFTGTLNLTIDEGDTARVSDQELSDLVSYNGNTQPGSITLGTNDADISIQDHGESYDIIPAQGVTGPQDYFVRATTQDGREATQNETLEVNNLPNATILVQNNETDQTLEDMIVPDQLTAHIGVYDSQGNRTDTLSNQTGRFEVTLPDEDGHALIKARLTRNGSPFSYVRTDSIGHDGMDVGTHETRLIDWYLRDINGNVVDELQKGAEKAASPDGFKYWVVQTHGGNIQAWNDDYENNDPILGGFPTYFQHDEDGDGVMEKGPARALLPQIYHSVNADENNQMHPRTQDAFETVYNELGQWTDGQLPAIEYPDSLSFNYKDNQYEDAVLMVPISHPQPSEWGGIGGYGVAPNDIYNTVSRVRSVNLSGVSDSELEGFACNETLPVVGLSTTVPAGGQGADEELTTRYQSCSHNSFSGDAPTNFDGKYIRMTYEPTFTYDVNTGFGTLEHILGMPPGY